MKNNKKKNKKKVMGPVVEILFIGIIVVVASFLFNLIGVSGYKTEVGTLETTLLVVNNSLFHFTQFANNTINIIS